MSQQLPSCPNLRFSKSQAKRLLKQWLASEPAALQELRLLHPSFELCTSEQEDGAVIGPIQLNYRMGPPDWIIEHETDRVQREQKQPAAKRAPIDPKALNRHIPLTERPRTKGMNPDDYGRLPGGNGYITSYPPGQDLFSLMDAANAHFNRGGGAQGYVGGPRQGNSPFGPMLPDARTSTSIARLINLQIRERFGTDVSKRIGTRALANFVKNNPRMAAAQLAAVVFAWAEAAISAYCASQCMHSKCDDDDG